MERLTSLPPNRSGEGNVMEKNISSTQKEEVRPLQPFLIHELRSIINWYYDLEETDEMMIGWNLEQ